jgi:hypothetical protein
MRRCKNPLRKLKLSQNVDNLKLSQEYYDLWLESIKSYGPLEEPEDLIIQQKFTQFKKHFPNRAENWIKNVALEKASDFLRTKMPADCKQLFIMQGIKVYSDRYTNRLMESPQLINKLRNTISIFLRKITGILPNKGAKIIITDSSQNNLFNNLKYTNEPVAIYCDRIIWIDENYMNNVEILVHEYAHLISDLIPKDSHHLLDEAYKKMLDFYWKPAKIKKVRLEPTSMKDIKSVKQTKMWREKISKKLGFPQYGLINSSEFFSVLIENWDKLPTNAATYKYKQIVKKILMRL